MYLLGPGLVAVHEDGYYEGLVEPVLGGSWSCCRTCGWILRGTCRACTWWVLVLLPCMRMDTTRDL
ncbi:hypothetical protein DPMN_148636 [Dreissena polymorpha]|uniref:Uncharacterized protein n=1 Tax=Dreissena polymorpha TaxID=45954 RepID=A0A9D4FC45_DREPO|nr:hypothetical protein DPMN_148636 [Dreissena polymorpha]